MSAPDRIWTASTYGKCHVGFDTPSMNYTNEYIRKDASDAAIAAARAEGVRELREAGNDVIRASNTLMLMLAGEIVMTKAVLETAIRRALDARNAWDNAIRAAAEAQP